MPDSDGRPDWLNVLAGAAAVIVIVLFLMSFLHEWVISAPGNPVATPI
jgi:hypothetical protein